MADLDCLADFERCTAIGAALAFERVSDVRGDGRGEIAARGHVAEVIIELVGASNHVGAALEGLIERGGEADGAEIAGGPLEPGLELLRAHIAELARASDGE